MSRFNLIPRLAAAALVFAAFAGVVLLSPALAQPLQAPQRDLAAPARWAVNQVVYASTSTSAAAERAIDSRINEQRRTIEALRGRLTQAGGRNEALATELSTAQERYCADLAERDRAYAQEIAVLRGAAEDIAATPEGLVALERFNAGDELGALLSLDRLRDARERARQVRNNIESAAEGRDIATLALEARNRGMLDTGAVIVRYEEVTRLDPGMFWDWIELGRLYRDAGNLGAARSAAEHAVQMAPRQTREEMVALGALGGVLVAQGDLNSAAARYEDALGLANTLFESDGSSLEAGSDLAVSLRNLADVAVRLELGDPRALAFYELSLVTSRRSADMVRPLYEAGLSSRSPAFFERDVSVSLNRIGDVLLRQGDLINARARYEEGLAIRQRLAAEDPSSVSLQRDILVSLNNVGNVLVAQGDLTQAHARYEESMHLSQRLAAQDPSSALLQRDVWVSMRLFARELPGQGVTWTDLATFMEGLDRRGLLAPADRQSLEEARANAAREPAR